MRRSHFDGGDDFHEIDAIALSEQTPLVEKCKNRRPVGIFHDLTGLGFNRAIHDCEWKLFRVEDFPEEFLDAFARSRVATGANPPEIANAGDVFLAGHDALKTVRQ